MKFAYTVLPPIGPGRPLVRRPILQVEVHGPRRSVVLDMLVDSGSDNTLLSMTTAKALDLEFTDERWELLGVGGRADGRVARARFSFGGFRFDGSFVATEAFDGNVAILGQHDFFEHFWVAFDNPGKVFFVSSTQARGRSAASAQQA